MEKNPSNIKNEIIAREKLLLRQLEELAKTGSWELNLITHALYWSDGVFKLLEYEPNEFEVTFEKAITVIHPDDREIALQAMQEAINNGSQYEIQKRFITKTGLIKYIRSTASVLFDAENKPYKMIGVFQDVTETVLVEKNLKQTNERLEMVLQAGFENVWDYNPITNEMYLSESFIQNFGAPNKHITNNDYFNSLYHPNERDEILNDFRYKAYKTTQTHWLKEFRFKKINGEYAYVRDRAFIKRNDEGKAIRVVGAIQDISTEYYYRCIDIIEKEVMTLSFNDDITVHDLLHTYLEKLENVFPDIKTSVLRIEAGRLFNMASPSLPKEYIETINGMVVGEEWEANVPSSNSNIPFKNNQQLTEAQWANFTGLAQQFNLGSCWVQPILNAAGVHIANLLVYFNNTQKGLNDIEVQAISRAQRLISVFLIKLEYLEHIKTTNERYALINKATNDAIYDWDVLNDVFYWGDSFYRIFGYTKKEQPFRLMDWAAFMHPYDAELHHESWEQFIHDKQQDSWKKNFRFKRADGSYAYVEENGYLIRDDQGKPIRMIGVLRDVTTAKILSVQQELQQQIGEFFKQPLHLKEQLQHVLEYLVEYSSFATAEFWMLNYNQSLLQLITTYASKAQNDKLYTHPNNTIQQLNKGEGLAGKVWQNKQWQIWENIEATENFLQNEAAQHGGIKSALGMPLLDFGRLVGVIIFTSNTPIKQHDIKRQLYYPLSALLGAEIIRRQQEEQLQLFFNAASDFLAIVAPNGYFVKINNAFCNVLGYTEKELTQQPIIHWLHPDDVEKTEQQFLKPISHHSFINRYRTKWGNYRWISWNTSQPYDENELLFAYGRDITDLLHLEELLQTATQLSKIGAWEFDIQQQKLQWSEMTKDIHEVAPDYVPELQAALAFYRTDYRPKITELVQAAITNGTPYDIEVPLITAKGKEKWVRIIGHAEMQNNYCVRLYGSIQDIHLQKTNEILLQKNIHDLAVSNRELEQFAYVASHDLQEPIRMIASFLGLLEQKYKHKLDEQALQYIHFAVDAAKRMRQLILDVLELSRVGKIRTKKELINLNDLLKEVCNLQKKEIEDTGAIIQIQSLPELYTYKSALLQVFSNLINNALKYRKKNIQPQVTISATQQNNGWLFTVADNGIGIESDYLEQIFIIFQRLHTHENYAGTGIGLAIVKKIIEQMEGKIWAESVVDKGSVFYFWLPNTLMSESSLNNH